MYSNDLDKDFYGTSFEVYQISRRVKRKGGGPNNSLWCGDLRLSVKQCNWVQKNIFMANGSTSKFSDESLIYLASRVSALTAVS